MGKANSLSKDGILCVLNKKVYPHQMNTNRCLSLPLSLQMCLHELEKQFSDSHRVKRLSGMRLEALER